MIFNKPLLIVFGGNNGQQAGVTAKEEINRFRLNFATFVTADSSRQSATFGFLMWNDLLLHGRRQ